MVLGKSGWVISLTVVVGLYVVFALARPTVANREAAQVDTGRRLYAAHCAACHGANLEGQANWRTRLANGRLPAPPHDASGHTWHHSDQVLLDITKKGPAAYPAGYGTDMPAYADKLTDEDMIAILAFVKSTWPAEIRDRQQRLSTGRSM